MRLTGWLIATVFIGGCVTPELKTAEIGYYSQSPPVEFGTAAKMARLEPGSTGCLRVTDSRLRTQAQGWSFPPEQIRPWLIEGLRARLGVDIVWLDQAPDEGPYIALETLYIKHIATSMAGVTVLRAHGGATSRAVRGNMTRMNWNGTDREFSRVLSQSLDDAVAKLPLVAVVLPDCAPRADESASMQDVAIGT